VPRLRPTLRGIAKRVEVLDSPPRCTTAGTGFGSGRRPLAEQYRILCQAKDVSDPAPFSLQFF